MDRCSIILEDKNIHYALISKVIRIIKEKYNCRFNVDHLTSLNTFSTEEKEYLKEIFSPHINELYLWCEHQFMIINDLWDYQEFCYYDYGKTVRTIMRLLNQSKIPLGKTVSTNDYQLISDLWDAWKILWEDDIDIKYVHWGNHLYKENYAVTKFISNNLKRRIGDSSTFDFAFMKAFMEARHDYFSKKCKDAIMGVTNVAMD